MQTECAAPWLRGFDPGLLHAVRQMPIDGLRDWLNAESRQRSLATGHGKPLQFVTQEALPPDIAYESWIAQTGWVPTRDNLHDRYNAMLWLSAPKTKARLNALQAEAIAAQPNMHVRGGLRDAATIWDENLAVVVASCDADALTEALRRHDWAWIFRDMRQHWGGCWQAMLFGHALLEKLEQPFKAITAHAVIVAATEADQAAAIHASAPLSFWGWCDERLVQLLGHAMTPAIFHHLPVLGVPGWDAGNHDPAFYDDAAVFRPARRVA